MNEYIPELTTLESPQWSQTSASSQKSLSHKGVCVCIRAHALYAYIHTHVNRETSLGERDRETRKENQNTQKINVSFSLKARTGEE